MIYKLRVGVRRIISLLFTSSEMSNPLIRRVSLTFGPRILETLVKHYFARVIRDGSKAPVPLQRDELLYDAAFNLVKVLVFCLAPESY